MIVPDNWQGLVKLSLDTLRKWESYAADLKWAREVLGDIFKSTCEWFDSQHAVST